MRRPKPTLARPACAVLVAGFVASLTILGPAASPAKAGEELYRWMDEAGQVVISDRPPEPGTPHETLLVKGARSLQTPSVSDTEGMSAAPIAPSARQGDNLVANPKTCGTARANLHALETAGRIKKISDDGEPYFLTEGEKEIEKDRARSLIRVHCRPGDAQETNE